MNNEQPSQDDEPQSEPEPEPEPEFKYIVRLANTDIDGNRSLAYGLCEIKGIGYRLACTIVDNLSLSRRLKIGNMSDEEIEKIAEYLDNISDETPSWMVNRQADLETGDDLHYLGAELDLVRRDDLNLLKKMRCYRGIRHENGHKVRGQRTRSNGRSGLSLGVSRKRK